MVENMMPRERDASDDMKTVYIWNKKSINASTHSKEAFFSSEKVEHF